VKTRIWLKSNGRPSFGSVTDGQVLRYFFVSILHLIEHEEGDDTLAFRVLGYVERDVEIDHASEDPADSVVGVAHQPPVFDYGNGLLGLVFFFFILVWVFVWLVLRFIDGWLGGARGGVNVPGFSAVPRFSNDNFSPAEIW
jgi:hypothetical protein